MIGLLNSGEGVDHGLRNRHIRAPTPDADLGRATETTMRVPTPTAVAFFCALAFAVVGGSDHAAEITVCSSGCDYTSIQDAVDDASPSATSRKDAVGH